ncbi:fasciclin-like arabinogalactan protein 11 [Cucurbita maxima]|uniref:Fasciclin-like arabinogalactan protein 11 n=1 Tax=Cucurbita maxima TaxID=3661 RepID=A0A6J1I6V0_CUCMA|nr:fasciclin-like arabinogalactan protein 11 [Cucurbita maxima]
MEHLELSNLSCARKRTSLQKNKKKGDNPPSLYSVQSPHLFPLTKKPITFHFEIPISPNQFPFLIDPISNASKNRTIPDKSSSVFSPTFTKNNLFLIISFFLTFLFFCKSISAQSSQPPGPSALTNITAILEKADQFTTLIKLLKSTQHSDQINNQLNNFNQGLTVFAPPDNAFSNLKPATLNSLSDQQKVQLLQFHALPTFISISQFQTVSNPLRTQAGNSNTGQFPLNVPKKARLEKRSYLN